MDERVTTSQDLAGTVPVAETIPVAVKDLTKVYGTVTAVNDITFSLKPRSTVALLGGNGAGKTTTIAMLLGLLEPTAGDIHVLGIDMKRRRYAALPRMNFSSPYVDLPHRLTVRQNLLFYGRLYGVKNVAKRIDEIAEHMQVGPFLDRQAGKLSAGQKTRVALAKALINKPDVLLLDEPTASLDAETEWQLLATLKELATTTCVVVVSHRPGPVEAADAVWNLKGGRLVAADVQAAEAA
jgi:ABC-2 type transport system ATP-binding protein